jgi:hypothetical protein
MATMHAAVFQGRGKIAYDLFSHQRDGVMKVALKP